MKHRNTLILFSLSFIVLLSLTACKSKTLSGTYILAAPPATDEPIVKEVVFSGDTLTMRSDLTEQTVKYALTEKTLTIFTAYGDFSFDFELRKNSVIIDSLEYIRQ